MASVEDSRPVSQPHLALPELHRLGAQHDMRKIDVQGDAAARTGISSCSTCRRDSTGPRPSRTAIFCTASTSSVRATSRGRRASETPCTRLTQRRIHLFNMCYMTKCPYVPPHPWNVDFPHVMLRAKAVKFRKARCGLRDRLLSSTDASAGSQLSRSSRKWSTPSPQLRLACALEKAIGVHRERELPPYSPGTFRGQAAAAGAMSPATVNALREKWRYSRPAT